MQLWFRKAANFYRAVSDAIVLPEQGHCSSALYSLPINLLSDQWKQEQKKWVSYENETTYLLRIHLSSSEHSSFELQQYKWDINLSIALGHG